MGRYKRGKRGEDRLSGEKRAIIKEKEGSRTIAREIVMRREGSRNLPLGDWRGDWGRGTAHEYTLSLVSLVPNSPSVACQLVHYSDEIRLMGGIGKGR